jgi:hypothetical protein
MNRGGLSPRIDHARWRWIVPTATAPHQPMAAADGGGWESAFEVLATRQGEKFLDQMGRAVFSDVAPAGTGHSGTAAGRSAADDDDDDCHRCFRQDDDGEDSGAVGGGGMRAGLGQHEPLVPAAAAAAAARGPESGLGDSGDGEQEVAAGAPTGAGFGGGGAARGRCSENWASWAGPHAWRLCGQPAPAGGVRDAPEQLPPPGGELLAVCHGSSSDDDTTIPIADGAAAQAEVEAGTAAAHGPTPRAQVMQRLLEMLWEDLRPELQREPKLWGLLELPADGSMPPATVDPTPAPADAAAELPWGQAEVGAEQLFFTDAEEEMSTGAREEWPLTDCDSSSSAASAEEELGEFGGLAITGHQAPMVERGGLSLAAAAAAASGGGGSGGGGGGAVLSQGARGAPRGEEARHRHRGARLHATAAPPPGGRSVAANSHGGVGGAEGDSDEMLVVTGARLGGV